MKERFAKKIRSFLLPSIFILILAIFIFSPIPFGTHTTHAFLGFGDFDFESIGQKIFDAIVNGVGTFYSKVFEWILIPIVSFVLALLGLALDVIIKMNLDTSILRGITGIDIGWKIIRDLINMSFIFILLYVAISTILQVGHYQAKQYLPKIIIATLLINFSLFFSKVIIDAGNIVAHGFYNSSVLAGGANANAFSPLSTAFRNAMDIEKLYTAEISNDAIAKQIIPVGNGDPSGKKEVRLNGFSMYLNEAMRFLLICVGIYVFASVIFIFVGRIIGLTFALILSPFGFIGSVIPGASSVSSWWWKTLIDQTLVAPVFMVLLFLALKVTSGFASSLNKAGLVDKSGAIDPIFYVNFIITIGLLLYTVKMTKKLGGDFGSIAQKIGGSIVAVAGTVALGAATGGAAFAARGAAGLAAKTGITGAAGRGLSSIASSEGKFLGSKKLGDLARTAARRTQTTARDMSKAGFDIREGKGFQKLAGSIGLGDKSKWAKNLGVGGLVTRGFSKNLEEKAEKEKKYAEIMGPDSVKKQQDTIGKQNEVYISKLTDNLANREEYGNWKATKANREIELASAKVEAKQKEDLHNSILENKRQIDTLVVVPDDTERERRIQEAALLGNEAPKLVTVDEKRKASDNVKASEKALLEANKKAADKQKLVTEAGNEVSRILKEETNKVTNSFKDNLGDLVKIIAANKDELAKTDLPNDIKKILEKSVASGKLEADAIDQLNGQQISVLFERAKVKLEKEIKTRTIAKEAFVSGYASSGYEGQVIAQTIRDNKKKKGGGGGKDNLRKLLEAAKEELGEEEPEEKVSEGGGSSASGTGASTT